MLRVEVYSGAEGSVMFNTMAVPIACKMQEQARFWQNPGNSQE